MTDLTPPRRAHRVHPAWWVAAVAFVALLAAAGFRAAPGALMVPLHEEFGWSTSVMSFAVSINLVLFGLTAPFAAALMDLWLWFLPPRSPIVGLCTVAGWSWASSPQGRQPAN